MQSVGHQRLTGVMLVEQLRTHNYGKQAALGAAHQYEVCLERHLGHGPPYDINGDGRSG